MYKSLLMTLGLSIAAAGVGHAAVLDFNELPAEYQGQSTAVLSNATITATSPDLFNTAGDASFGFGASGGFCAVDGFNCSFDTTIAFTNGPVSDLSFTAAIVGAGDTALATVFGGSTALGSFAITSDGTIDFAGISGITSLFLDDLGSTAFGIVYGDFAFTQDAPAPIPLPAGMTLLLGALGTLGLARRRRPS